VEKGVDLPKLSRGLDTDPLEKPHQTPSFEQSSDGLFLTTSLP
jgi:hypothetical protein